MWIKNFNIIIWALRWVSGLNYKKHEAFVVGDQLAKASKQG